MCDYGNISLLFVILFQFQLNQQNIRLKQNNMSTSSSNIDNFDISATTALTPLDGRYASKVKALRPIFSEYGLIRYRSVIEIKWLQALSKESNIKEVPNFSSDTDAALDAIINNFSVEDAEAVKNIEATTNHDVKAVEYFLKQSTDSIDEVKAVSEFFHFACTSEDINNLSYALMLHCLLYTSPSPRDLSTSRMPSSA